MVAAECLHCCLVGQGGGCDNGSCARLDRGQTRVIGRRVRDRIFERGERGRVHGKNQVAAKGISSCGEQSHVENRAIALLLSSPWS